MTAKNDDDRHDGMRRLLDVVARLRGEGGCPWDREQTLETLNQYLIEESYEVVDAVESGDPELHKEELGDVLLQVVLQSRIREEEGTFDFDDVARKLADKLVRRHPHVFGDVKVSGTDHVLRNWESIKADEKENGKRSVIEGVPRHLPALQKAQRVQGRVARVGFDWSEAGQVANKVTEELAETMEAVRAGDSENIREEIGDLLFSVVNLARFEDVNAEEALQATIAKFSKRFSEVESRFRRENKELADCTLAELDACWEAVKSDSEDTGSRSPDTGCG